MRFIEKIKEGYRSAVDTVHRWKEDYILCRIFINKYTIVILAFVLWIAFFDSNSAGVLIRTNDTIARQREQIESLKSEIASTQKRIEQLNSQKDTLERFAREEYLFHENGEVVYLVK